MDSSFSKGLMPWDVNITVLPMPCLVSFATPAEIHPAGLSSHLSLTPWLVFWSPFNHDSFKLPGANYSPFGDNQRWIKKIRPSLKWFKTFGKERKGWKLRQIRGGALYDMTLCKLFLLIITIDRDYYVPKNLLLSYQPYRAFSAVPPRPVHHLKHIMRILDKKCWISQKSSSFAGFSETVE